jgi:hypothetical protein
MDSNIAGPSRMYRWVSFLSLAAVLAVGAAIILAIGKFRPLMARFGADLPAATSFMLKYGWLACMFFAAIALASAAFLLLRPQAPAARLRTAFMASLAASIGSCLWYGFLVYAMYLPISMLGEPV